MAEGVEIIAAELRLKLDEMENDMLVGQKRIQHFAKEFARQGEEGGKLYVKGFNKGAADFNRRLNDFVGAMSAVSPKAGAAGDKIAKLFSKPIFAMIPAITSAIQAMLPIIGTVVLAVAGITAGISKALNSNENFRNSMNNLKSAMGESFAASARPVSNFFANIVQKAAEGIVEANILRDSLRRLREGIGFGETLSEQAENLTESYPKSKKRIAELTSEIERLKKSGDELSFAEQQRELDELNEKFPELEKNYTTLMATVGDATPAALKEYEEAMAEYEKEEKRINLLRKKGAIDEEERSQRRLSNLNSYINSLSQTVTVHKTTTGVIVKTLEEQIAYYNSLEQVVGGRKEREKAEAEAVNLLDQANKDYQRTLAQIENQKNADYLKDGEYEAKRLAAEQQYIQALSGLKDEYTQLGSLNDEQIAQITALEAAHVATAKAMESEIERSKRLAAAQENIGKYAEQLDGNYQTILADLAKQEILNNDALTDYEKQLAVLELQRQAALDELAARYAILEAERGVTGLLPEEIAERDRLTAAINRNFNALASGVKELKDERSIFERIFDSESYQAGMQIGQAAISAFDSISSQALAISQKHAEEQIAIIDAALERTMEQIEEARQMELEAEGFIEAQSEEQIQKQIDAAKRAGDEVLQYQLERRMQEKEINDRYDAQAKAAEKKAAKEKADIEYQAAKEEFALSLIQAANAGVMAVLQALASAPPPVNFVLAGLSGAAAAAQLSILAANPPKPPAFASGGVVPGRRSDGDTQNILATAGEVILNAAQQENVAEQLTDGGETMVNIAVVMNEEVVGRATARWANAKGAVFERRVIMGLR
jgi:hypothetical protein